MASIRARLERTSVRIVTDVEGAAIYIDGVDRARTPRPDPIPVQPGSHEVEVRLDGEVIHASEVAVNAGGEVEIEVAAPPSEAEEEVPSRAGAWALIGGGGGVLVVGAVLGGVGLGRARDVELRDDPDADSAKTLAVVGDTMMALGAAAAVGGLVWILVTRPEGDESEQARIDLAPVVGPTEAGISMRGSF